MWACLPKLQLAEFHAYLLPLIYFQSVYLPIIAAKRKCIQHNVEYLKLDFISASNNDQRPIMLLVIYKT